MIGLHYAVVLPLLGGLLVALALLLDIAGKPHATKVLRYGLLSLLVGWIIYIIPFITLDYTLAEVARNANDDLSFALRLASSWAGGGNSLYLYTVFLAATILYTIASGKTSREYRIASAAALLTAFAAAALNGAFETLEGVGGFGINPLLKSYWIIPHPLTTFGGYALLLGGSLTLLFTREERRGMTILLAGWGLLTLGITFGALWSYETMGWGGYWAWDPVEISELMVWLASTSVLHSIGPLSSLRRTALAMTASSTLLAPYVTRSGLSPLHSFAAANIGALILLVGGLAFLALAALEIMRVVEKARINPSALRRMGLANVSVAIAGLALFAMAFFVYSTVAIPSVILATGRPAEIPSMAEGVSFYHPVLYPLFTLSLVFVPGYFLSREIGEKGFLALTATMLIAVIAGLAAYAKGTLVPHPRAGASTNIQTIAGVIVAGIVVGALAVSIGVSVRRLRRRTLGFYRDLVLKLIHIMMAITFIGILLSGTYAFNDKYFETYRIPLGETVQAGPVEIGLIDYEFQPNKGTIDLAGHLNGTSLLAAAWQGLILLNADFGQALLETVAAAEEASRNTTVAGIVDLGIAGTLESNETIVEYRGNATISVFDVLKGSSRVIYEGRVNISLLNATGYAGIQPRLTQEGSLVGASLEAAIVAGKARIEAPIDWGLIDIGVHNFLVINLSEPINLSLDQAELQVYALEVYANPEGNATTQFAPKMRIGDDWVEVYNVYARVSSGVLHYESHGYRVPVDVSRGLFLYILSLRGDAPLLRDAMESSLVDALTAVGLDGNIIGPHPGQLRLPKDIPSGASILLRLRVDGEEIDTRIRFEANGEASGIHGLVNPVVTVKRGFSDVYIAVLQPMKTGYFNSYHEPILYYLKHVQEKMDPEEALAVTSIMAVGYHIAELTRLPPDQGALLLEQVTVDMYLAAEDFDPANSSLATQGLIVRVKVVPGVNLVWIGSIGMGVLGLASSAIYALLVRRESSSGKQ